MKNIVEDPALQYNFYSMEEYWDIEASTENKNEYYNGNLFVMQGASLNHNRIVSNLMGMLHNRLKSTGCSIFVSDLRLNISSANAYVYPDAMIICGEPELTEDKFDTVKNPSIVFEVISKSTEANDRRKFFYYMQMGSVKEIIFINSFEQAKVEVGVKQENGSWQITTFSTLQDEIELTMLNEKISLADIYENIQF